MNTHTQDSDFVHQLKTLSREGKHDDIIRMVSPVWNNGATDPWTGYYYAVSLNRKGNTRKAYDIASSILHSHPDFEDIISPYLYSCYKVMIEPFREAGSSPDLAQLEETVQRLLKISEQRPTEFFRTKSILCLASIYIRHAEADKALEYLELINPFTLDKEHYKFENQRHKEVVLQSDFEKFYGFKAKAYEMKKEWENCLLICEEALKQGVTDIWIRRRLALSKINTGKVQEGLDELKELSRLKKEWYILIDIAETSYAAGKNDEALEYAVTGLMRGCGGSHDEFIVRGLSLVSQILRSVGKHENAALHDAYEVHVRLSKGMPVSDELSLSAASAGYPANEECDITGLLRKLNSLWFNILGINDEIKAGAVSKIPDGKKYGFIKGEDGVDYFFLFSEFFDNPNRLKPGLKVMFQGRHGYDPVKKRKTIEALKIKVL
ncbi:MAG: cold shock domain-containing protein [Ignavibacteriales bacterium]|nr:hypothetical protein [Ignavibacteriaceae bacterium]QOJ27730.1 MAG: cold shock domain-containing protein [Ignavibacteriales bacterium]